MIRVSDKMNYTHRFDGKSDIYEKARPKYASGLFDYLKNTLNIPSGSVFADIGSGTGIFTEQLLGCGYRVFAVEPNIDMRKKAEEKLSHNKNFVSVNGSDSDMKLPSGSVDYITAAQAFHWFDAAAFKKECRRVLKPEGEVIIVYNSGDKEAPCARALAELFRKYNPEFRSFSNGMSEEKCRAFFAGDCAVFRTDNTPIYDRQGYTDRVLSSSYSLRKSDSGYSEYLKGINMIFDRFSLDGKIAVPTDTVAYIGKPGQYNQGTMLPIAEN